MSTAIHRSNAKTPSPARPSTEDSTPDTGPVLAQIPDLAQKTAARVPAKRTDGRIIDQALSIKLVFGVGFGLVIGAILPFMFGKASRSEPVKELPAWSNNGHSALIDNGSRDLAPSWQPSATPPAPGFAQPPPGNPPNIVTPQVPQFVDQRSTPPNGPVWPDRRSLPTPPANRPIFSNDPNPAVADRPSYDRNPNGILNDSRTSDRTVNPNQLQADVRGLPAAPFRPTDGGYNRDNPATIGPPPQDTPRNSQSIFGPPPPVPSRSPLMPPDNQPNNQSNYRPSPDPGVARFDGSITPPPLPVNYDRSGPGN